MVYGAAEALAGGPAKLLRTVEGLVPAAAPAWLRVAGPAAGVGAGVGLATAVLAPYAYSSRADLPKTGRDVDLSEEMRHGDAAAATWKL